MKNVGVNSLRSSYATYQDRNRMTVNEKKMRTSRRYLDLNQIKMLPSTQTASIMATITPTEPNLIPKETDLHAYKKQ